LKTRSQDFVGYPVVNCGFGGSRLSDCVWYMSRLVLRLKPVAVVIYAGDDDLAQGALPDQAFASFREFYAASRGYSKQMPMAYISVKPCPARIRNIDNILRFNQMVQAFLQTQPANQYIDIYTAMLGLDNKPNPALFVQDQIHLSDLGYQMLRRDVSSFLTTSSANIVDLASYNLTTNRKDSLPIGEEAEVVRNSWSAETIYG
jgi:lysophospholipase L1-like esterase